MKIARDTQPRSDSGEEREIDKKREERGGGGVKVQRERSTKAPE